MNKNINHKLLVVFTFSMMLVFGIIANLKGQINPLIQSDYGLNNAKLGFILTSFSLGGILASIFSGGLIRRFTLKKFLIGGLLITAINLIAVIYINNYNLLLILMGVIGLGLGMFNVASNTLASLVFVKNKGRMMNLFHLFFGLGGFFAPKYANQVFNLGFEWEYTYAFSVMFIAYLVIFSLLCSFPKAESKENSDTKDYSILNLLKDPRVVIFTVMFALSVGVEVGTSAWLGVYLDSVRGMNQEEIGSYLSLYFALFVVGRFTASIIVEKVGYLRLVLICVIGSIITILLGVFGPPSFIFFLSVTGLFISVNFPTMQAAMFETFEKNIAAIIGLTLAAAELGNILIANSLEGFLNDILGLRLGYGFFAVYLVILGILTYHLKNKYLNEGD